MIVLTNQAARISHLNLRTEKHGEEDRRAIDIKLEFDLPNEFLNDLHPGLLDALYMQDEARPDLLNRSSMPRYPYLGVMKWTAVAQDWQLTIRNYNMFEENYDLIVDLGNMNFTCLQGGTVVFRLRAQLYPSDRDAAVLYQFLGAHDMRINLQKFEEEPSEQGDLDVEPA